MCLRNTWAFYNPGQIHHLFWRNKLKKFIAIPILLVSLVFALACGGDDEASNGRTITGAIDSGVVSDTTNIGVQATDDSGTSFKGTITAGSNGEDHTYSISGLSDGVAYTVSVFRSVGLSKVTLLETVVTASSSTGTLALSSKARYKRQANMVTTYISKKYAASRTTDSSVTLSSVVTTVFGSSSVSLDTVVSEGGSITVAGSAAVIQDAVAATAITQLTFATVAAVSMSDTNLSSQSSTFSSFASTLATATTQAAVTGSISSLGTLVSSAGSNFATLAASADATATTLFAAGGSIATQLTSLTLDTLAVTVNAAANSRALAAGATLPSSFLTTLASAATITASAIQSQAVSLAVAQASNLGQSASELENQVNNPTTGGSTTTVTISSFELASASYGSRSGNDFTVNTLAPIFKVVFSSAVTSPSSVIDVTLTNSATSASQNFTTASSYLNTIASSDNKTHYIMVKKSSSAGFTDSQGLRPGTAYTYAITAKTGYALSFSGRSENGTITTEDVTFTLPFDGSSANQSLVNISDSSTYNGLNASSNQTFYVNVKSGWKVQYTTSNTTTYGIFGGSGVLNATLSVDGATASAVALTGTNLTVHDINDSSSTGWTDAFGVTLASSVISASKTYTIAITSNGSGPVYTTDGGTNSGALSASSYPASIIAETAP